ncbi:MAG: hypothetical protein OEV06_12670, partial [Anaerolineae bacterium]|nr:hypothetical protein [Anaerolineae bacterium]
MFTRLHVIFALSFSALLYGCSSAPTQDLPQAPPTIIQPSLQPSRHVESISDHPPVGLTYQSPDGNRFIEASGSIPDLPPIDIPLDGVPEWVVSIPIDTGSLWAAVLQDGRVQAFIVNSEGYSPAEISPPALTPGMPPVLTFENGTATVLPNTIQPLSPSSHSLPLFSSQQIAFIDENSHLSLQTGGYAHSFDFVALPDARILSDGGGRLLLLTGPTTDYSHGVLGDSLEASGVALVNSSPDPGVLSHFSAPNGDVIEGIAPIWTDLDGDGSREIIITLSNSNVGAFIGVFSEAGEQLAASQPIGQGFRWRHQIAAAPFGPNGEIEIVNVLTPHIGGVVEFLRWEAETLVRVADISGFSSHLIGSRNLDMAAAVDFDGDGKIELIVPTQDMRTLAALQR